jgi:hypothetical protein
LALKTPTEQNFPGYGMHPMVSYQGLSSNRIGALPLKAPLKEPSFSQWIETQTGSSSPNFTDTMEKIP